MIYLDNIIFSLQNHGGVSVLWGKLIENRIQNSVDTLFLDFRNAQTNQIRKNLNIPQNQIIENNRLPILLERYKDVTLNKIENKSILHSSHYRISKNHEILNVTTVHDFTYEYFSKGIARSIHTWQKYRAIRNSEVIICISENTKKDLLRFLPDIDSKRIRVVYNGVSEDYRQLPRENLPDNSEWMLYVGGRQSYKNFKFAIACAREINKKLYIVGSPLNDLELKYINSQLGPLGYKNIINPSNKDLNVLYNSVDSLIYPSLYEGFGIPVIEAQKAGCPVIALNTSSIPEIIGNQSVLLNSPSLSEFTHKYSFITRERENIINEGLDNAKRFSWDSMIQNYNSIYSELLS